MDKTVFIPGPDPKLELSYNDVWLSGLFSRRVLVFQLTPRSSHAAVTAVLEKALDSLVRGTPELGSESVVELKPGNNTGNSPWRALKPYAGIEFIVRDLTKSFPNYTELERRGFPVANFKDSELMPVPHRVVPVPQPQAKFQLTLIEGGLLLSVCILHHLTDGNGMNTIVHALRNACARADGATETLPSVVLNTDRTIINSLHSTQLDIALHPAYAKVPNACRPKSKQDDLSLGGSTHLGQSPQQPPTPQAMPQPFPPGITPSHFQLTSSAAARLKSSASRGISPTISTHDAILALLWRTLTLARLEAGRIKADDTVTLTCPVDVRRHLGLPRDWVGNCVYFCTVQSPVAAFRTDGDGELETLATTAKLIRTALNGVDRARVESLMAIRREDPYGLALRAIASASDPAFLTLTSFYNSGLMEGDWGSALGSVKHFTTTDAGAMGGGYDRTASVGPMIAGGKGCSVIAGIDAEEMRFFSSDSLWNSFLGALGE